MSLMGVASLYQVNDEGQELIERWPPSSAQLQYTYTTKWKKMVVFLPFKDKYFVFSKLPILVLYINRVINNFWESHFPIYYIGDHKFWKYTLSHQICLQKKKIYILYVDNILSCLLSSCDLKLYMGLTPIPPIHWRGWTKFYNDEEMSE